MTESKEISKDLSVSMTWANLYSLFFAVPLVVLLAGGYLLLWGKSGLQYAWHSISRNLVLAIFIFIAGIIVHELLHGLAWAYFGKKPFRSIRFGFNVKAFSPYAHCREAMTIQAYRWGAAIPGLMLGLIPSALGLILGNGSIMIFGLLFTAAAGGDALIIWLIRKENSASLVLDHTSQAGCVILKSASDVDLN